MLAADVPLFSNRREAGRRLASALLPLRLQQPIVLALPRGGVPIGFEIAQSLSAPLDILLVRKIGVPGMPEVALGAVVDGSAHQVVWNKRLFNTLKLKNTELEALTQQQLEEIERRRQLYRGSKPPFALAGKTAIVVDDGIATGSTMKAALRALERTEIAALVVATPVAPPDVWESILRVADQGVCLYCPEPFGAVGRYYSDFEQLEDQEVIDLLIRADELFTSQTGGAARS